MYMYDLDINKISDTTNIDTNTIKNIITNANLNSGIFCLNLHNYILFELLLILYMYKCVSKYVFNYDSDCYTINIFVILAGYSVATLILFVIILKILFFVVLSMIDIIVRVGVIMIFIFPYLLSIKCINALNNQ